MGLYCRCINHSLITLITINLETSPHSSCDKLMKDDVFHEEALACLAPKAWAPMGRALQDWQAGELGKARKVGFGSVFTRGKLHSDVYSDVNPFAIDEV